MNPRQNQPPTINAHPKQDFLRQYFGQQSFSISHCSFFIALCYLFFAPCSLLFGLDFAIRPRAFAFFPSEVKSAKGYPMFSTGGGGGDIFTPGFTLAANAGYRQYQAQINANPTAALRGLEQIEEKR